MPKIDILAFPGTSALSGGDEETLSQQVFNVLRSEILTGRLPPGTRLVRRAIAKRLHISTIPVVEALLRLEMDGLVESVPHAGARVAEFTLETLQNDRVLREAIECQTARILAEHGSDSQFEFLAAKAEVLDEIERDAVKLGKVDNAYLFAHFDFHASLADATGWTILVNNMRGIWFRRIMVSIEENKELFNVPENWHAQLVEAIRKRDPDKAEAKMREHVRHSQLRFRDSLKEAIRRDQAKWLTKINSLTNSLPEEEYSQSVSKAD